MKICFVGSRMPVPPRAIETARGLAEAGHEVHLLLAPGVDESGAEGGPGPFEGLVVHRLATPARWGGILGARRMRRAALSRALCALNPSVVHVIDGEDGEIRLPGGPVVLRGGSAVSIPSGADAVVTAGGRFLGRDGAMLDCPDLPPESSAGPVADGLDPEASASQWRVMAYLAGVDQLRRSRRVRFDRGHGARPPADRRHFRTASPRSVSRAVS